MGKIPRNQGKAAGLTGFSNRHRAASRDSSPKPRAISSALTQRAVDLMKIADTTSAGGNKTTDQPGGLALDPC
jgi:hypothetical protein